VGVVSRTKDKFLVSEESDYNVAVKEYLNRQLGIRVLTVSEALELAQDP
jgi:hypothetical protein